LIFKGILNDSVMLCQEIMLNIRSIPNTYLTLYLVVYSCMAGLLPIWSYCTDVQLRKKVRKMLENCVQCGERVAPMTIVTAPAAARQQAIGSIPMIRLGTRNQQ